jgi:hypothetical protein
MLVEEGYPVLAMLQGSFAPGVSHPEAKSRLDACPDTRLSFLPSIRAHLLAWFALRTAQTSSFNYILGRGVRPA